MRRLGVMAAAFVMLLTGAATAETPPPRTVLRVTGAGGQQAVLTVPPSGMRIDYPLFRTPRLTGPDGTIGGVVIQQLPSRRLVGGLLLQNVPGFDGAIEMGLVNFDGIRLAKGRYALTLLGSGRQSVTLELPDNENRALVARGPARPITRTLFASSTTVHKWTDAVEVLKGDGIVVLGDGAGGDQQQAALAASCFGPAAADDGLCLTPTDTSTFASPGAGGAAFWSSRTFDSDATPTGRYSYSGRVAAAGPRSLAAHSSVLITLPR